MDKETPRSKSPLPLISIIWYIAGATTNISQQSFDVSGPPTQSDYLLHTNHWV